MDQSFDFGTPMGRERQNNDHNITLIGRRKLDITGVKQVESFDNEEFLLETVMGFLSVRGQNLQMKSLNVELGNVSIEGKILDLIYLDEGQQDQSKGFFGKLFK